MGPEHAAFVAFVEREYATVVGAVALYCGDVHVAQEVAQDAFAKGYQRWAMVSQMDRPGGWVLVVALNLARSRFRRRSAERRALARHGAQVATVDPSVAEMVSVRAAVSRLPQRQREAIICRYFLDCSVAETARMLQVSEGAVKSATFKAIASLRGQFDLTIDVERSGHA